MADTKQTIDKVAVMMWNHDGEELEILKDCIELLTSYAELQERHKFLVDTCDKMYLMLKERQKTGSWTILEDCSNSGIYCSECHVKVFEGTSKPKQKLSQYCPHCGSKNEQFYRDGNVVFR